MPAILKARFARAFVCALIVSLGIVPGAFAQTTVSGVIASDAHWTKDHSPYLLMGDVQIVAGAHLTIDSGVSVYVADGKNLIVSQGALSAVGSKDAPILISSKRVFDGQPGARGAWGQLRFLDGTVDADTRLDNVVVEFGRGIQVTAATLAFNQVTVQHNAGAAITTDLAASLTGGGNRATDNDIDAIAVPAGVIQADVRWGLHGIQYFVADGLVEVGSAPQLSSLTPNSIQIGESIAVQASGDKLAGLQSLTFDKPGISAELAAPATNDAASVQLTVADDATAGPVTVTALTDAGTVRLANAFTIVPRQPQLLTINPSVIYVGQGDASAAISGKSLAADTQVMLGATALATTIASSNAATAVVPNQTAAGTLQISLRTPDPSTPGTFFTTASLPLQVLSPTLTLTPATANTQAGQSVTLKIALPYPAPAGGLAINLSSSNTAVATVVGSATIPQGASEANVVVNATALGTVTIRASRSGYLTASAVVNVTPPPALSVSPSLLNVAVGTTLPVQINLTPAPTQDTTITLTSSNPVVFTVPGQAVATAGATSVTVAVSGVTNGQGAINASAAGYNTGTATILVSPKSILMPTSAVVAPGATRTLLVALNAPAPAGGLIVNLASSNTSILTLPNSVTVAEGTTSASIAGVSGVAQGNATVTATASGFQTATTQFTVRAIYPSIYAYSVPVNFSNDVNVYLSDVAPAGGIGVDLTLDNPALASLSQTHIDIPAGANHSSFAAPRLTGLAPGTVRITASSPDLQTTNTTVTISPSPGITVSNNYGGVPAVGKSLKLTGVTVALSYSPGTPVTVALTSSQPDKVQVPASVVIPAGQSSTTFEVKGLELTTTTASISASAPGFDGQNTPMGIDVLPPMPYVYNYDQTRVVGSARDDVYITFGVNRSGTNTNQMTFAPISVVMSLATASPVGIVDGFYADGYTATATSTYVVAAGTQSLTTYVGSPSMTGSYSIRADIPGAGSATTPLTQVVQPKLMFSLNTETAVRGFKLDTYELTIQREAIGNSLSNALTVYLISSDPGKVTVPASVTIPANQSSVRFALTGVANTEAGTPATIDATAAGFTSPTEKLNVDVIDPQFYVETYNGDLVVGQEREYFDVYASNGVDDVVPLADIPVTFSIVEANPSNIVDGIYSGSGTTATLITSAVMRANSGGGVYGYFGVPTAAGSFRVQIEPSGYQTALSQPINVTPGRLGFDSSYVQSPPVIGASLAITTCVYALNNTGSSYYVQTPVVVNLTSADPSKLSVPPQVTIPTGNYRGCFDVSGVQDTAGAKISLDASATGFLPPYAKFSASVAPITWKLWSNYSCVTFNCSTKNYYVRTPIYTGEALGPVQLLPYIGTTPVSQRWGMPDAQLPFTLQNVVPAGSVAGFYKSDKVTPTSTLPMSASTGFGAIYVQPAQQAGSYSFSTQLPDGTNLSSGTITVIQDALGFNVGGGVAEVGVGTRYTYRVARKSNLVSGEIISLACVDTTICSTPATVTTSYNSNGSGAYFNLTGLTEGTTILTAAMPGVAPAQVSVVVAKTGTGLDYLPTSTTVGNTTYLSAYLHTPASGRLVVNSPRVISLSVSAPGIVSVPATVTIPANYDSISVPVTGVGKGTVTITATEPGSNPSSGSITVN